MNEWENKIILIYSNLAFTYPTMEGEDKNERFERAYNEKWNNGKSTR